MENNSTLEGLIFYEEQTLWSVSYLREYKHLHYIAMQCAEQDSLFFSRTNLVWGSKTSTTVVFSESVIYFYQPHQILSHFWEPTSVFLSSFCEVHVAFGHNFYPHRNLFKLAVIKKFITQSLCTGSSAGRTKWIEHFSAWLCDTVFPQDLSNHLAVKQWHEFSDFTGTACAVDTLRILQQKDGMWKQCLQMYFFFLAIYCFLGSVVESFSVWLLLVLVDFSISY